MFLTCPVLLSVSPTEGLFHEGKTLSVLFLLYPLHLEQCLAHLSSNTTFVCMCVAALHQLISSGLSYEAFSKVLEVYLGQKCSEVTPTGSSLSQWDLSFKYSSSLALQMIRD